MASITKQLLRRARSFNLPSVSSESAIPEKSPLSEDPVETRKQFAALLAADPASVLDATRDGGGHVVLNADDLFKRWPPYREDPRARRWLGPVLYEVGKNFIDRLFTELLVQVPTTGNTVVFTAGGGASGKSTILRAQANRPEVDFVVDTTFSNTTRAIQQIDAALGAGRLVEVNYVYRDFKEAVVGMIKRALDPNVGRIVPIDDLARTHFGAQETIFTLLQRYENEPRVAILLWQSLPNNRVKSFALSGLVTRILPEIDELQKLGQTILDEAFETADHDPTGQWQGLSGDGSFYEAARSKAQKGLHATRDCHRQGDESSRPES